MKIAQVFFLYASCCLVFSQENPNTINIASWYPVDYCVNTTFYGYEYVILKTALQYLNPTGLNITCILMENFYTIQANNNTLMMISGTSIFSPRIQVAEFSFPTVDSSIGLAAKHIKGKWIFAKEFEWSGALILILLPFMFTIFIWITEDFSFSFFTYCFDLITSYFFSIEGRMNSFPSKILRIFMMLSVLVVTSIYLGLMVVHYKKEKTFNGLLNPGALFSKKINCISEYSNLMLQQGITIVPYSFVDPEEVVKKFEDLNFTHLLFDRDMLEIVVKMDCHIYMINPQVYNFQLAPWYGFQVNASQQRLWNEGIVYSKEQFTDKTLKNLAWETLPKYNEKKCVQRKLSDYNHYHFSDFNDLWILYGACVGISAISYFIEKAITKIWILKNTNLGINSIQWYLGDKITRTIVSTTKQYIVPSTIMMRLFIKERMIKISKNKRFKMAQVQENFKKLKQKSYHKVLSYFALKKIRLLSYTFIFLSLFKNWKKIKCKIQRKLVKKKFSRKKFLVKNKFDILVEHLLLEAFMAICFQLNLVSKRLACIKITEAISDHVIINLPNSDLKKSFTYSKIFFSNLQKICQFYILGYTQKITTKGRNLNPQIFSAIIEKIYLNLVKKPGRSPMRTLYLLKKSIERIIVKKDEIIWSKNSQKYIKNKLVNDFISIEPINFSSTKYHHQKSLKLLFKKLIYERLTVKGGLGTIQVHTPYNIDIEIKDNSSSFKPSNYIYNGNKKDTLPPSKLLESNLFPIDEEITVQKPKKFRTNSKIMNSYFSFCMKEKINSQENQNVVIDVPEVNEMSCDDEEVHTNSSNNTAQLEQMNYENTRVKARDFKAFRSLKEKQPSFRLKHTNLEQPKSCEGIDKSKKEIIKLKHMKQEGDT